MSADEKKKAADIGEFLDVRNLTVQYTSMGSVIHAVNGISFRLNKGETLALVGETGAGKTSIAKAILRILPDVSAKSGGEVYFQGTDMMKLKEKEMQKIRGHKISMIFQDPMTSLNPVLTVGDQIAEVIKLHDKISEKEAEQKAGDMLEVVGIPRERFGEYPHQFSGGMRQRVMIAMALACDPDILIADEPTTALDVTIQAQIIELMQEMQEKNGNAIIMITHDLGVVADMADKIMVMYAGRPVEFGTAEEIFYESRHPYTWGLIRSIPEQAIEEKKPLTPIHGNPPSLMNLPEGCVFSPRCPYATDKCRKQRPERVVTESGHYSACHYSGDPEFLKNAPETSRTRKDSKKGGEA